ncbi:MAG TPA: hypothetical protein EYM34_02210, partial [Alphaproteobacteria bacterium]|nr:hypothetical protein [Alphaproteobacteria bacterium]
MVYGFAQQSGGHATIDSRVGRGSTVRIYLPRSTAQNGTKRNSKPNAGAPTAR